MEKEDELCRAICTIFDSDSESEEDSCSKQAAKKRRCSQVGLFGRMNTPKDTSIISDFGVPHCLPIGERLKCAHFPRRLSARLKLVQPICKDSPAPVLSAHAWRCRSKASCCVAMKGLRAAIRARAALSGTAWASSLPTRSGIALRWAPWHPSTLHASQAPSCDGPFAQIFMVSQFQHGCSEFQGDAQEESVSGSLGGLSSCSTPLCIEAGDEQRSRKHKVALPSLPIHASAQALP